MPTDSVSPLPTGLSARTIISLRTFFAAQDHHPSQDHWQALQAIADTMEAMVLGTCPRAIYLSPVDPGVGKSRTVIHFARELVSAPAFHGVGLFISVYTIAEAAAMAKGLEDIRDSLCVLTSDKDANALGGALMADTAQVLITTQNRLGRLTDERPFSSATAFYYRGQPRACRVWDESILPGSAISVSADAIIGMASRLRGFSPSLTDALYGFGGDLLKAADGAAVEVPDFLSQCKVEPNALTAYLSPDINTTTREQDRETALALLVVNGRNVRVMRNGLKGMAMLTFREELPPDITPMLVLDASARVRETYALWQDRPGPHLITMLHAAVRDYSPLTVRTWQTGGGKAGWKANSSKLLTGIADTILTKPDEDWLVVVHKSVDGLGSLEKALQIKLEEAIAKQGLSPMLGQVRTTTWGKHTGSNDWADIPNVILAGTLFYPDSQITALHHLCANIPVEGGLVSREEVRRTAMGEHRHLILQAICRGRVRRSNGNQCQPMTAYVIASTKSGIPTQIDSIFPGCRVEEWTPHKKAPKGKVKEALEYVRGELDRGRREVSYQEVYASLGLKQANFSSRVAKKEGWIEAIQEMGCEIIRGPRGGLYISLVEDD